MEIAWDEQKNEWLKRERGVSFEMCVACIEKGEVLGIFKNKFPRNNQLLIVIDLHGYAFVVPASVSEEHIFLKTMYPSRTYQKIFRSENQEK